MMDAVGTAFLVIAIVVIGSAVVGFYFLSRKGPRGALLAVAVALYFCATLIPYNNSRELALLEAILKLTGLIGGILGIVDFFRKRPTPTDDSQC